MTAQVEWRKAIREREFRMSQKFIRSEKQDRQQLKKKLYSQVTQTENLLGQLQKEKMKMQDRLLRYHNEKAKIRSQQLLEQFADEDTGSQDEVEDDSDEGGTTGDNGRKESDYKVVEPYKDESDTTRENVFVSRLEHRNTKATLGGGGLPFELTESEEDIFNRFIEIKKQRAVEEDKGMIKKTSKEDEVNGLTLNKFISKCKSRDKLDFAIERAETFVSDWSYQATGEHYVTPKRKSHRRKVNLDLEVLQPAHSGNQGLPFALDENGMLLPKGMESLEKDFKAILQEAKKARYLRGNQPEILDRERDLTLDEIFSRDPTG